MQDPALESLPCSHVSPSEMWGDVRSVREFYMDVGVQVKVKIFSTLQDSRSICGSLKVHMWQIRIGHKFCCSLSIGVKLF